jgi:hypothetical protein
MNDSLATSFSRGLFTNKFRRATKISKTISVPKGDFMEFLEMLQMIEGATAPPNDRKPVANTRVLFANVEQLDEAVATTYSPSTGTLTITIIKPGWSKNNRYYPASLLKSSANIFEGAKMFTNHATDKEAAERPEGSVRDWVANITSVWPEADGTLRATAKVIDPQFKDKLALLRDNKMLNTMGISIRAMGEAKDGEAEGKRGKIIDSLLGCKSVDFVTFAGAGGQVESMEEGVDLDDLMLMDINEQPRNTISETNKTALRGYTAMGVSESDARRILNLPPAEIEALGRHVQADYLVCKSMGLPEEKAVEMAKSGRLRR